MQSPRAAAPCTPWHSARPPNGAAANRTAQRGEGWGGGRHTRVRGDGAAARRAAPVAGRGRTECAGAGSPGFSAAVRRSGCGARARGARAGVCGSKRGLLRRVWGASLAAS
eukprot:5192779-Prymnesium_polylepis.1